MRRYTLLTALFLISLCQITNAQAPDTLWSKTYGDSGGDMLQAVYQTADDGFIMAGGWDVMGQAADFWLVKTNAQGDTLWTKTYGGASYENCRSMQLTSDGGYILAGATESFGANDREIWLVKTNSSGDTSWTKTYGKSLLNDAHSVVQTADNGFLVVGETGTYDENSEDIFLVRTNSAGDTLWTKTYGGSSQEIGRSVQQTADGGYIIVANIDEIDGSVDIWLLKTDANGDTTWTKTFHTGSDGEGTNVVQTTDSGYAIFGIIFGTLDSPAPDGRDRDWLLIKTDSLGTLEWHQTYGGDSLDQSMDMLLLDDGFLLSGWLDQTDLGSAVDLWLVRTNSLGETVWTTAVGGDSLDAGTGLAQIAEGEYAVAGVTNSWGAGSYDGWLVRFGTPTGPTPFEQDSIALVALYDSTNGANWTYPWILEDPVSSWMGVTTSGGRVTWIELIRRGLTGQIPDEIGNLTALTYLCLAGDQLTGQLTGVIPDTIRTLPNLTDLNLSGNSFPGPLPSWIGSMTNLTSLQIVGSDISGEIPDTLGNLTNLTILGLGSNELTGSIPEALSSLVNLTNLSLGSNQLTGEIPDFIGTFTGLTNLGLFSNQLSGPLPSSLGNLTNVVWFWLFENNISGEIPPDLGNMAAVESLYLNDNQLTGAVPVQLADLANLSMLNLANNQLDELPDLTAGLPAISYFWAQNNRFTFEDIEPNMGISGITYSPQDSVGTKLDTTIVVGDTLTLSVTVGGSANQYQWYHNGEPKTTDSSYTINAATFDDAGSYKCIITSTIVTNLNLYSQPVNVTVIDTTIPAPPQDLTAVAGNEQVTLTWRQNTETDFLRYRIYGGTSENPTTAVDSASGGLTDTSRTIYGLTNGTTYYYRVTAVDVSLNESGFSNEVSAIPADTTPPFAPGNLTAIAGDAQVILTWDQNTATDFLRYRIYGGTSPSPTTAIDSTADIADTTRTIVGLTNETIYYFSVTAVDNALNESARSWEASAMPSVYSLATDSTALVALYKSTDGPNWNTPWDTLAPVSTWPNISVWADRVQHISLQFNNLTGTLPPEIGTMTALTFISLWGNELTGTIPDTLGSLTNLTTLALDDNPFSSGEIPAWIGNLVNLTSLSLSSDSLTGTIPDAIGNLGSLISLGLGSNKLSGSIPAAIGNLTDLTYLDLGFNTLSGPIPVGIGNLTSLEYLILQYNQLSSAIPDAIGNLDSLITLALGSNELSGSIPATLGNLKNLTGLSLGENQLTGPIPAELDSLTNLTGLSLSGNQLSGTIPLWLGHHTNYTILDLRENQLTGSIPDTLGYLTNLSWLFLNDNQLTGAVPARLCSLTNMTQLHLSDNQLVDLPDLSCLTSLSYFWVKNNHFTFEDLIPNMGLGGFLYSPQLSVGREIDTTASPGSRLVLSVPAPHASNHYVWRQNTPIQQEVGADNDSLIFESITYADSGYYNCTITNDILTDLTLYSSNIYINVGTPTGITDASQAIPEEYALHANYPNPFNPSTTIRYDLPEATEVVLTVYDLLGREVVRLVYGHQEPGYRQVIWNGRTANGREVPTGIYIARMVTPAYTRSIKMVLLK